MRMYLWFWLALPRQIPSLMRSHMRSHMRWNYDIYASCVSFNLRLTLRYGRIRIPATPCSSRARREEIHRKAVPGARQREAVYVQWRLR